GRGEDLTAPIADHTALRLDDKLAADLVRRTFEEGGPADRLPVADAQRQEQRRNGKEREQDAQTAPRDPFRHSSSVMRRSLPSSASRDISAWRRSAPLGLRGLRRRARDRG